MEYHVLRQVQEYQRCYHLENPLIVQAQEEPILTPKFQQMEMQAQEELILTPKFQQMEMQAQEEPFLTPKFQRIEWVEYPQIQENQRGYLL